MDKGKIPGNNIQNMRQILQFLTPQVKLKKITLNKMSDRERQILYNLMYLWNKKKKKPNAQKQREETRSKRWRGKERSDDDQGVQISSYKMKSSGHVMHSMVTRAYTTVLYIRKLLREEILSPHTQMITDGCVK